MGVQLLHTEQHMQGSFLSFLRVEHRQLSPLQLSLPEMQQQEELLVAIPQQVQLHLLKEALVNVTMSMCNLVWEEIKISHIFTVLGDIYVGN